MATLHDIQSALLHDIYNHEQTSAPYLDTGKFGSLTRLDIYTNNLRFGLHDSLSNIFPVLNQMVGDEFFQQLARSYIQAHPQHRGNRNQFGHQLANFLSTQPAIADMPYLVEVAAIEWAYFQASIANDAQAMEFGRLGMAINDPDFVLKPHPSVHIVATQFNSIEIWQKHQQDTIENIQLIEDTRRWMIWRTPENELLFKPVSDTFCRFVHLCTENHTLIDVMTTINEGNEDPTEFQQTFSETIALGVFI